MSKEYLFTSESVSEGHPDKLADQISDAVLDACLSADPRSRVACETFTTTGMILIGGEITTTGSIDFQEIAREVARDAGYTNPAYGLDAGSMAVMNTVHAQSPDISQGVTDGEGLFKEQGAGDQGMMFGYACNETEELMPAPITFAHKLLLRAAKARKENKISWLRPDSKSQVTLRYEDDKPVGIDTVVISHQHDEGVSHKEIKETIMEDVIKPVLSETGLLHKDTLYYVNPTGRFVVGGPLPHVMAAKAVALREARRPRFRDYAGRVVENARSMAEKLIERGTRVVTGGTDNHLLLLDTRPYGITGRQGEDILRDSGCLHHGETA